MGAGSVAAPMLGGRTDSIEKTLAELDAQYAEDEASAAWRWLEQSDGLHVRAAHDEGINPTTSPLSAHNLRRHLGTVGRMDPAERLERWRAADAV